MMATVAAATTGAGADGADRPKHRACDECRIRKLACTKEPDGCSRCKREGIKCHYSPQKQMGRPRKRQHVEIADEGEKDTEQDPAVLPFTSDDNQVIDFSSFGVDLNSPDFNLLDFISPSVPVPEATEPHYGSTKTGASENPMVWHQEMPQINFDLPSTPHRFSLPAERLLHDPSGLSSGHTAPDMTTTPSISHLTPQTSGTPSLSSTAGATPPDDAHFFVPKGAIYNFPNKSCSCIASIYLALESLSHLPPTTGPAMGVARTATKAAHDTIFCPTCSPPNVTDPNFMPPVQSFQVLMMLGALLPTLANVYSRILKMVDEEAETAEAEGRHLSFSLQEYGGLWGRLAAIEAKCGAQVASTLNGSLMEPKTWRLTVRALLRIDVYGVSSDSNEAFAKVTSCAFVHIGLRDIVEALEMRSKIRHATMDHAIEHGLVENPQAHGHAQLPPGEKHTCIRVIHIAKHAIENLVIA